MDGKALLADVLKAAGRLGLAPWERLVLVLALALLWVLGERGIQALREVVLVPQPLEQPSDDGRPADLPPASSNLTTSPDRPDGDI